MLPITRSTPNTDRLPPTTPVTFTGTELWVLHEYVRQHQSERQEWDWEDTARVQRAIAQLGGIKSGVVTLECSEPYLKQVTRQISMQIAIGTTPVGEQILIKVFKALHGEDGQGRVDHEGAGVSRTPRLTGQLAVDVEQALEEGGAELEPSNPVTVPIPTNNA